MFVDVFLFIQFVYHARTGGRGSSSSGRTEGAGGDSDDEAEFDFKVVRLIF